MTGQTTIVLTFRGHWPLQIPLPGLLLALPRQEGPRDPPAASAYPSGPTAAPSRQFATAAAAPEEQRHFAYEANLAVPPGIRVVRIPTMGGTQGHCPALPTRASRPSYVAIPHSNTCTRASRAAFAALMEARCLPLGARKFEV